jgi:hypothetical protein
MTARYVISGYTALSKDMQRLWGNLFGLNSQRSIWVGEEDLGREKEIVFKQKRYAVKIPRSINQKAVLRLKGLGRTYGNQTGDLQLHVWLNKGKDIHENLWLSETFARNGWNKSLSLGDRKIIVVVPPNSHDGMTIRLRGLGEALEFNWRAPLLRRRRGNLLLKLFVFPDSITPRYGSFDLLATEDMVLEGWVYQKINEIIQKIGQASFPDTPIQADVLADLFNELGWRGIFPALVRHLKLSHLNLELIQSDSISTPGSCQKTVSMQNNRPVATKYVITIHKQFCDNPFAVGAILAHELCHVIYSERISGEAMMVGSILLSEKGSLEQERTVDLLVFMFKIGEFQLRVARDTRLTLGYFHQELFERMQVIVAKKLGSAHKS